MPSSTSSDDLEWFRYPFVAAHDLAKTWLTTETLLGLAPNTLDAYARGLDDFLGFCQRADISPMTATRADLARYVGDLRGRPRPAPHQNTPDLTKSPGLSNATLQQRLTAVRLFFNFLIEEGLRTDHPVGRGRYTPGKAFGADRERALVPRFQTLPWIPSDEQWRAFWKWSNKLLYGHVVWLLLPTMRDCGAKNCVPCEATTSTQLTAWCASGLRLPREAGSASSPTL